MEKRSRICSGRAKSSVEKDGGRCCAKELSPSQRGRDLNHTTGEAFYRFRDPVRGFSKFEKGDGRIISRIDGGVRREESGRIMPSISRRIGLHQPPTVKAGVKYSVPVRGLEMKAREERRKELDETLNFCKKKTMEVPSRADATKLEIKFQVPSAEITQTKVLPRKPSTTPSDLYPEPPKKKDLRLRKPKSGLILNKTEPIPPPPPPKKKKKKVKKKKIEEKDLNALLAIEEMMARELATIEEGGEGEGEELSTLPETYLTKQFRRKVSQISKSTSIKSQDWKLEERGEDEEEVEEEEQFITQLIQKFRRDSEQQRYEKPKRKVRPGTLESHSFTRLRQPTLKTFYYGVKMGTIHQGDEHFNALSRDRQGICVPIAAYCYSILKHPDKWTTSDIDDVLEAGNALFLESAGNHHIHDEDKELTLPDLSKYCVLGDKKVKFEVGEPEISGMVRSIDRKVYNLTKGVNVFFTRHESGILQTDEICVAIWRDKHYYLFDGGPRTIDLFSNENGVALMAHFYDTAAVITVLLNRTSLGNTPFILYTIKAYKVLDRNAEEIASTEVINEMDKFKILNEEKAVVSGSFDLADKCFGFSRNKQAITIAVVSLVYSKITPASAWHKLTIDKIMIIGNQLFLECIRNDFVDEVTVDDLPAVFTVGPYVVEIFIYPSKYTDLLYRKQKCQLEKSLEKFFEKNRNAILQIDKSVLAVWKQRNMYFCFDPYSRNTEGTRCRDGAACVTMHATLPNLVDSIANNFESKELIFYIHVMKVCKIHRDPNQSLLFPKGLTMNDYPIECFKGVKMRKGKKMATGKPVTVDYAKRAALFGEIPDASILEVGSNVRSLGMDEVPPMVHKFPSRSVLSPKMPDPDFVADLDSPSLSDTQIEPVPLEEGEEKEISMVDLDSYDLTQEELELMGRGEGEDKAQPEQQEEEVQETRSDVEAEMEEQAEAEGEDWYYTASEFAQVHSYSLASRRSKISEEINTDIPSFDFDLEELPAARRKLLLPSSPRTDAPELPPLLEDVTMSQELAKDTNFVKLPDGSQVVLGTKNMADYGSDLEFMAPFVGVMAAAVAKKYCIDSWSKDIVDYVLKCGSELQATSNMRYDQVYKLEIPKIALGRTEFSVQVEYVFDTYIKPRVLEMAITKILFAKSNVGILMTPTYSCALFYKNNLFYLYDGFGNNELGLGKGPTNFGVACLARFTDIRPLVTRILHNKSKREVLESVNYNRFVLSACTVKRLTKEEVADDDEDDLLIQEGEGEEDYKLEVTTYKKGDKTREEIELEDKDASNKVGYQQVEGLYKIEGSRALGDLSTSDTLKEDYFTCLCASLLLLNCPLRKWDTRKIDQVLDQGEYIFANADNLEVCSKKFIKNILIDVYLFNIVTKRVIFPSFRYNKNLKTGIESMLAKKHENFILQFPSRSYVICIQQGIYNLFDPNDKSGRASWTRFISFRHMLYKIQGGESYNFHTFDITAIAKAPRDVIIGSRLNKYKTRKGHKPEEYGKSFEEEQGWLSQDPIPWSWRVNKNETLRMWKEWYEDWPNDVYSMFGTINPVDPRLPPETRGYQFLGILVVAIGMTQVYELEEWTPAILDSIVENGDNYFYESIKGISAVDHQMVLEDLKRECSIFPYTFGVKFTPVVEGTMFLHRLKHFNLYKALRYFFDDYERRFGIVFLQRDDNFKRQYAFGKTRDGEYFLYDCETLGPPMFTSYYGVPYVLRVTSLNRLLYVMTLTLRGGDFFIYEVAMSDLKPLM